MPQDNPFLAPLQNSQNSQDDNPFLRGLNSKPGVESLTLPGSPSTNPFLANLPAGGEQNPFLAGLGGPAAEKSTGDRFAEAWSNPERGLAGKLWDVANVPLLDEQHLENWAGPIFGHSGWAKGAYDLVSGFTSPLSIGLLVGTWGAGALVESGGEAALTAAKFAPEAIKDVTRGSQFIAKAIKAGKTAEEGLLAAENAGINPTTVMKGLQTLQDAGLTSESLISNGLIRRGGASLLRSFGTSAGKAEKIGRGVQALVDGGFTAQMAYGAVMASPRVLDALKAGDYEEAKRLAVEAVGSGAMAYLGARHGLREAGSLMDDAAAAMGLKVKPSAENLALMNQFGIYDRAVTEAGRSEELWSEDIRKKYPDVKPAELHRIMKWIQAGEDEQVMQQRRDYVLRAAGLAEPEPGFVTARRGGTQTIMWADSPSKGLIEEPMGDRFQSHAEWFGEDGVAPASGAKFDQVPRGFVTVDDATRTLRFGSSNGDEFVPRELIDKYEQRYPNYDLERVLPGGKTVSLSPAMLAAKRAFPTHQELEQKFGTTDDVTKAGFILPGGKMIPLRGIHDEMLGFKATDNAREDFIAETGAVRSRFRTGRAGQEMVFSIPAGGVDDTQAARIRSAAGKLPNGRVTIETVGPDAQSVAIDFPKAGEIQRVLDNFGGGTPWVPEAMAQVEKTGGVTWNPRRGRVATGYAVEIMPEYRQTLDHPATNADLRAYYQKHRAMFEAIPDLHVGVFGNEINMSATAATEEAALHVARRLDQMSVANLSKIKPDGLPPDEAFISAGGSGKRTSFPEYDLAQRLADIRGENPDVLKARRALGNDAIRRLEASKDKSVRPKKRVPEFFDDAYLAAPAVVFPDGRFISSERTHQQIAEAAGFTNGLKDVARFLRATSAVRIMYPEFDRENTVAVEIHGIPTDAQRRVVADVVRQAGEVGVGDGRTLTWDLRKPSGELISGQGTVGEFQRTLDESEALKARRVPTGSTVPLQDEPLTALYGDVPAIARRLERYTLENLEPLVASEENRAAILQRASSILGNELHYQLGQENSGISWYVNDIKAMHEALAELHPELKANPVQKRLFNAIAAVSSPGKNAALDNINIAEQMYGLYKDSGKIPLTQPDGTPWGSYGNAPLRTLQTVLDKFEGDEAAATKWLRSKHTLEELQEMKSGAGFKGKFSARAFAEAPKYYGAYILGPKVGPFFLNLEGIATELTMDRWWLRTWNRAMGTLVDTDGRVREANPSPLEREYMREAVGRLGKKFNLEPSQVQAALWYYEQNLYQKHGQSGARIGGNYADAAREVVNLRSGRDAEAGRGADSAGQDALARGAGAGAGRGTEGVRPEGDEGTAAEPSLFAGDTSFDPEALAARRQSPLGSSELPEESKIARIARTTPEELVQKYGPEKAAWMQQAATNYAKGTIAKAWFDYTPREGDAPGYLQVDPRGRSVLNGIFGDSDWEAITVQPKNVPVVLESIDALAENMGQYDAGAQAKLRQLRRMFANALAEHPDGGVAIVPTTGSFGQAIPDALQEERFHILQTELGKGKIYQHADLAKLAQEPEMEAFAPRLQAIGYSANPRMLALEAAAHIAVGDAQGVGGTLEQRLSFLDKYFTAVAEQHGPESIQKFESLLVDEARPILERVSARLQQEGRVNAKLERLDREGLPGLREEPGRAGGSVEERQDAGGAQSQAEAGPRAGGETGQLELALQARRGPASEPVPEGAPATTTEYETQLRQEVQQAGSRLRTLRNPADYQVAEREIVSRIAKQFGLNPSTVQASLWRYVRRRALEPEPNLLMGRRGQDVHTTVAPEDFLKRVGAAEDESVLRTKEDARTVDHFVEQIRRGEKIDPVEVVLDDHGNVIGAEGRHRAMAYRQAGVERIPVVVHRLGTPEEEISYLAARRQKPPALDVEKSERAMNEARIRELVAQQLIKKNYSPKEVAELVDSYDHTKLTPEHKALAKEIAAHFAETLEKAQKANALKDGVEHYVTQLWGKEDSNNPAANRLRHYAGSGAFSVNTSMARHRMFQSAFEGELLGKKLRVTDPVALASYNGSEFGRVIAAREALDALRERGFRASDGRPMVALAGRGELVEGENGENPAVFVNPKQMRSIRIADNVIEGLRKSGDLDRLVKQDAIRQLGKNKDGQPIYGWNTHDYLAIDHAAMQGWNFASQDSQGNPVLVKADMRVHPEAYDYLKKRLGRDRSAFLEHPVGRAVLAAGREAKGALLFGSPFHLFQEGLRAVMTGISPFGVERWDPRTDPLLGKGIEAGLTMKDYHGVESFEEGKMAGHSKVIAKIPGLAQAQSWMQHFLFEKYIPGLKARAFKSLFERYKAAYPGWTMSKVAEVAAADTNERFGGINYKRLGRSTFTQDWARVLALAPDWLESEMRFMARTFGEEGRIARRDVARLAIGLWVGARVLNYLSTGSFHTEAPFGLALKDKDGKEKVYSIRTLPTDMLHAISDPGNFLSGRVAPLVKSGYQVYSGRDEFGRRVPTHNMAVNVMRSASPIWMQTAVKSATGEMPEMSNTDQFVKAAGATVHPYRTEAEQIAAEIASDHSDKGPVDPAQTRKHQAKMRYESDIRTGRMAPQELFQMVENGQLSPQEGKEIMKGVKDTQGMPPDMARLWITSSRLPAPDFLKVWDVATNDQKAALAKLLIKKRIAYFKKAMTEMTPQERMQDPTYLRLRRLFPQEAPF